MGKIKNQKMKDQIYKKYLNLVTETKEITIRNHNQIKKKILIRKNKNTNNLSKNKIKYNLLMNNHKINSLKKNLKKLQLKLVKSKINLKIYQVKIKIHKLKVESMGLMILYQE
jgi:hypothetical protein